MTIDLTAKTGKYKHNFESMDKIIADYDATVKRIQQRNEDEKTQNLRRKDEFQEALAPMITATENQTKDLTAELQKLEPPTIKLEPRGINLLDRYKDKDQYFAIHEEEGHLILGDRIIDIDQDSNIHLDDRTYKGTPGLWEMIMETTPRVNQIPEVDMENYKELAVRTNLMDNPNPKNATRDSRPFTTSKYRILKSFGKTGEGVVFLPSDINSLEEKLSLLLAEFNAGNRAETRNQIVAIIDQLVEKGVIGQREARDINDYLSRCL